MKTFSDLFSLGDFSDYYQNDLPYYIIRDTVGYYDNLLSLNDVSDYLNRNDLSPKMIKISFEGQILPFKAYSQFGITEHEEIMPFYSINVIDKGKVLEMFNKGAVIQIENANIFFNSIDVFNSMLTNGLQSKVSSSIALMPLGTSARPLFHSHSKLTIQVHGTSTYNIYHPIIKLPYSEEVFNPSKSELALYVSEIKLGAGSVFFIPKGYIYELVDSGSNSLQVQFEIQSPTWYDLLSSSIYELNTDRSFRESYIGYLLNDNVDETEFSMKKANFLKLVKNKKIAFQHTDHVSYLVDDMFADAVKLTSLNFNTLIRNRFKDGVNVRDDGDSITVLFGIKRVKYPRSLLPIMKYLTITESSFSLNDLPEFDIDKDTILVLLRELIQEGLFKIE